MREPNDNSISDYVSKIIYLGEDKVKREVPAWMKAFQKKPETETN